MSEIQGVPKILGKILGVSFQNENKEKVHIYICHQTINFRAAARQRVDFSHLVFYPERHLKP